VSSDVARARRLTREQGVAQDAATAALQTAHENRLDARKYRSCLDYAARAIETTRATVERVDRHDRTRAWGD
jgi:hypothetical protein